jgi:hypothetical protein
VYGVTSDVFITFVFDSRPLSLFFVDFIALSHFAEVIINDGPVRPQEEVTCEAGDCLELKMLVTNSLEKVLGRLTLSVQFYQDYENGTVNYRMETRLATAGATK